MASSLLSLYAGGGRRKRRGGRSAAAVKQLLSRLRSTWRRRVVRPRRRATVTFGYDLHSYHRNFDDGLGSCGHRRL